MKKDVLKITLLLVFMVLISLILIVQVQASESENDGIEIGEEISERLSEKTFEKIGQNSIVCIAYGDDYFQEPMSSDSKIFLRQSKPPFRLSTRVLAGFYLLGSAIFLLIIFLLLRKVRTLDMFVLEYKPRLRKK